MEKRTPHYPLSEVKRLIQEGSYRVTDSALSRATEDFRLTELSEIAACVRSLTRGDFYKSMTTIHDSRLWQDVYHGRAQELRAYIKLQIVNETTVIISFKLL